MQKFLIINPFGIGDVLCSTPVIKAIKTRYPDSFIGYWSNIRTKEIIEHNEKINRIYALSRGDIKKIYNQSKIKGILASLNLQRQLKKEHFGISLDFSLDHRYAFICWLCGIKRRIGFNYKNRGKFLTDKIELKSYDSKHIVEYYLDLLKPLNIIPTSRSMELRITESAKSWADKLFYEAGIKKNDCVIGIFPGAGASWGKDAVTRHWPAENFAQVAKVLYKEFSAKIIILGDSKERALADSVINRINTKSIDMVGKTSLIELAALMSKLNLLISNDGGPMHMAVAIGINTVSLIGPIDEKVYGPYPQGDEHLVVKKDLDCRPCYQNFKLPVCVRDRECLKSIDIEEVLTGARRLLQ